MATAERVAIVSAVNGRAPVLVTGWAGYVGSHVVLALCAAGWPVVVLDDLSTGSRAALPADTPGARQRRR